MKREYVSQHPCLVNGLPSVHLRVKNEATEMTVYTQYDRNRYRAPLERRLTGQ